MMMKTMSKTRIHTEYMTCCETHNGRSTRSFDDGIYTEENFAIAHAQHTPSATFLRGASSDAGRRSRSSGGRPCSRRSLPSLPRSHRVPSPPQTQRPPQTRETHSLTAPDRLSRHPPPHPSSLPRQKRAHTFNVNVQDLCSFIWMCVHNRDCSSSMEQNSLSNTQTNQNREQQLHASTCSTMHR
jgi:hypothetical protein